MNEQRGYCCYVTDKVSFHSPLGRRQPSLGMGEPTSDMGAFWQRCLKKRKNWVRLGAGGRYFCRSVAVLHYVFKSCVTLLIRQFYKKQFTNFISCKCIKIDKISFHNFHLFQLFTHNCCINIGHIKLIET